MDIFVSRLNSTLTSRGMKAIDLSRRTGFSKSSISQYLAGKIRPKQDKLDKIAEVLMVSPAWLLGYDVPEDYSLDTACLVNDIMKLTLDDKKAVRAYLDFLLSKY